MTAEVAQVSVHEIAGRLRDHYLGAVCSGTDSRTDNNVEADETLVRDSRLTGVNTNANPDGGRRERALNLERSVEGGSSPRERNEERVPLRINLDPAIASKSRPQKTAVLTHNRGVVLAELVKELRRALNVREKEGDRPTWEAGHRSTLRLKPTNDDYTSMPRRGVAETDVSATQPHG
jgi:hypothetical protein